MGQWWSYLVAQTLQRVPAKALDGAQSLVSCCAGAGQVAKGVVLTNVLGVATLGLQPSGLTKVF